MPRGRGASSSSSSSSFRGRGRGRGGRGRGRGQASAPPPAALGRGRGRGFGPAASRGRGRGQQPLSFQRVGGRQDTSSAPSEEDRRSFVRQQEDVPREYKILFAMGTDHLGANTECGLRAVEEVAVRTLRTWQPEIAQGDQQALVSLCAKPNAIPLQLQPFVVKGRFRFGTSMWMTHLMLLSKAAVRQREWHTILVETALVHIYPGEHVRSFLEDLLRHADLREVAMKEAAEKRRQQKKNKKGRARLTSEMSRDEGKADAKTDVSSNPELIERAMQHAMDLVPKHVAQKECVCGQTRGPMSHHSHRFLQMSNAYTCFSRTIAARSKAEVCIGGLLHALLNTSAAWRHVLSSPMNAGIMALVFAPTAAHLLPWQQMQTVPMRLWPMLEAFICHDPNGLFALFAEALPVTYDCQQGVKHVEGGRCVRALQRDALEAAQLHFLPTVYDHAWPTFLTNLAARNATKSPDREWTLDDFIEGGSCMCYAGAFRGTHLRSTLFPFCRLTLSLLQSTAAFHFHEKLAIPWLLARMTRPRNTMPATRRPLLSHDQFRGWFMLELLSADQDVHGDTASVLVPSSWKPSPGSLTETKSRLEWRIGFVSPLQDQPNRRPEEEEDDVYEGSRVKMMLGPKSKFGKIACLLFPGLVAAANEPDKCIQTVTYLVAQAALFVLRTGCKTVLREMKDTKRAHFTFTADELVLTRKRPLGTTDRLNIVTPVALCNGLQIARGILLLHAHATASPFEFSKTMELVREPEPTAAIRQDEAQMNVFAAITKSPVLVVNGAAGSGKSFMMASSMKKEIGSKQKLAQRCAPTNCAVRVIVNYGQEAMTMDRFILEVKADKWKPPEDKKFGETISMILEEFSMVDEEKLAQVMHIITRLRKCVSLIVIGDEMQLPSVGPGAVLRDLIRFGPEVSVQTLRTCHRVDSKSSALTELANVVATGQPHDIRSIPGLLTCVTPMLASIKGLAKHVVDWFRPDSLHPQSVQIMAYTNRTRVSVSMAVLDLLGHPNCAEPYNANKNLRILYMFVGMRLCVKEPIEGVTEQPAGQHRIRKRRRDAEEKEDEKKEASSQAEEEEGKEEKEEADEEEEEEEDPSMAAVRRNMENILSGAKSRTLTRNTLLTVVGKDATGAWVVQDPALPEVEYVLPKDILTEKDTALTTGICLTVHSLQGSGTDHAIYIVEKKATSNHFYTGITRARENLTVVGMMMKEPEAVVHKLDVHQFIEMVTPIFQKTEPVRRTALGCLTR